MICINGLRAHEYLFPYTDVGHISQNLDFYLNRYMLLHCSMLSIDINVYGCDKDRTKTRGCSGILWP